MTLTSYPPELFGIVEPHVYRANAFQSKSFAFISNLNLCSVVFLSPETPTRALTSYLRKNNVQMVCVFLFVMNVETLGACCYTSLITLLCVYTVIDDLCLLLERMNMTFQWLCVRFTKAVSHGNLRLHTNQ